MRFLADAGISPKTISFLIGIGHEAIHVRTIGMQAAEDPALVQRAIVDNAVILTFDLDFGDILALGVLDQPSVVIFGSRTKGLIRSTAGSLRSSPNGLRISMLAR